MTPQQLTDEAILNAFEKYDKEVQEKGMRYLIEIGYRDPFIAGFRAGFKLAKRMFRTQQKTKE